MKYEMTYMEMLKALEKRGILRVGDILDIGVVAKAKAIDRRTKRKTKVARRERLSRLHDQIASKTSANAGSSLEKPSNQPSTLIDLLKAFREEFKERAKDKLFRQAQKGSRQYKTRPNDLVALRYLVSLHGYRVIWTQSFAYFDQTMRQQKEVSIEKFANFVRSHARE